MPGGVLQQNTLYSGLLITDKQDRINEKIMLEFLKKRILHEFKYNHQSANTDTEYKQTDLLHSVACHPGETVKHGREIDSESLTLSTPVELSSPQTVCC